MALVFWSAALFVAGVYAGYPALIWLWARVRPRPVKAAATIDEPAGVTIVIAARNEGHRLRARIENLLQLDYPSARRQIVIVSDGSTDDTDAVLGAYRSVVDGVSIPAGGKARALNAGVARARFDTLVFADARQLFERNALIELTRPFADPSVGAVTGELLLDCESAWRRSGPPDRRRRPRGAQGDRRLTIASTVADGVGAYWRYEKALRRLESSVGSTLGATGAIYAVRRSLWSPLPPDTILDDVLTPMRIVLAGYRVVFNPAARAFDRTAPDAEAEAGRKVRTLAGNFQILWLEPRLLVPWRNPVWLQYFSHKIGRLVVPYALLVLLGSTIVLAANDVFYLAMLVAQCAFYLLAGYGAWLEARTPRAVAKEIVNA